eukprot:Clim_evm34s151 gene=Clim_evmTU34s151
MPTPIASDANLNLIHPPHISTKKAHRTLQDAQKVAVPHQMQLPIRDSWRVVKPLMVGKDGKKQIALVTVVVEPVITDTDYRIHQIHVPIVNIYAPHWIRRERHASYGIKVNPWQEHVFMTFGSDGSVKISKPKEYQELSDSEDPDTELVPGNGNTADDTGPDGTNCPTSLGQFNVREILQQDSADVINLIDPQCARKAVQMIFNAPTDETNRFMTALDQYLFPPRVRQTSKLYDNISRDPKFRSLLESTIVELRMLLLSVPFEANVGGGNVRPGLSTLVIIATVIGTVIAVCTPQAGRAIVDIIRTEIESVAGDGSLPIVTIVATAMLLLVLAYVSLARRRPALTTTITLPTDRNDLIVRNGRKATRIPLSAVHGVAINEVYHRLAIVSVGMLSLYLNGDDKERWEAIATEEQPQINILSDLWTLRPFFEESTEVNSNISRRPLATKIDEEEDHVPVPLFWGMGLPLDALRALMSLLGSAVEARKQQLERQQSLSQVKRGRP